MLKVTCLDSGLRVATFSMDRPLIGLVLTVGVGRRLESDDEVGFSHFLEHLLCAGTKSYPTPKSLDDSVRSLGGYKNAFTSIDTTTFVHSILVEHLDQALKTLSEQIQSSLLLPDEIDRQRQTIQQEQEGYIDKYDRRVHTLSYELLWPGHPMNGAPERQIRNLPNVSQRKLIRFMDKYYTANNMCLTFVGNLSHELALEKAKQYFDKVPTTKAVLPDPEPIVKTPGVAIKTETKEKKQLQLTIAFYAPASHEPESLGAELLEKIVGDRMTESLRHRHRLSYSPQCDYSNYEKAGSFSIGGAFHSGRTEEVLRLLWEQVELAKSKPPSETELSQAKIRIKTSIFRMEERVLAIAENYSKRVFFDYEPLLFEDELARQMALTPEDILHCAQGIFTENFKIAALGPPEDLEIVKKRYQS